MDFTGERFIPNQELMNDDIGFEHLHRYHSIAPLLKGKKVLDIACGEGYGTAIIAQFATSVVGVDVDTEVISAALDKYTTRYPNVNFMAGSASNMPLKDKLFDVVVSLETIEHLSVEMQHHFMEEVKRVLLPGGILVMSTPDKEDYSDKFDHNNPFHLHEFYKAEYETFIKSFFNHLVVYYQGYEVVSIISNESIKKEQKINIINWPGHEDKKGISGKYMVAIASDIPLGNQYDDIISIVPDVNKDYQYLTGRLVTMNSEIEELGKWGKSLDNENRQFQKEIELLVENLKSKEKEVLILKNEIKISDKNEIEINEIKSRNSLLGTRLYLAESRLNTILDSKWWGYALKYQAIKKKYLSNDSPISIKINNKVNLLKNKKNTKAASITGSIMIKQDSALSKLDHTETMELPFSSSPLVSIIIPAFNNWEINYRCIKSIILHTENIAYEVILADDCSSDETKDCTTVIKNIVHIHNETNLGFLYNCNNAAKHARGEYILFLNNDTEATPIWLSSLLDLIKSDDKIGMVGSKLIYPDGRLQEAGGIIWDDASGWNYGKNQNPEAAEFNYVKEVDYISGACILLAKKLWQKIGGFDEIYAPAYCEDSDLAFTVRKMGYKIMYQPLSQIIHHEGFSHGKDETVLNNEFAIKHTQVINNKKLYNKWESMLEGQLPNAENVFNARDRSINKKTIVVIDHNVPHYDQDAGSKTTFQYLELLVSLDLNVKFIGDNFNRPEPYTTTLQQMGVEVLYGKWYADNWQSWIIENEKHIDFFYLNRPHTSLKYLDFIKQNTHAKILYYGHDLHFLREVRQYAIEKDPKTLVSAANWEEKERYLFKNVDIVLTPSKEENKIISLLDPSFKVETVLPYFFKNTAKAIESFKERNNILFVGGFGHTPNVDAMLWFCKEIWPLLKLNDKSTKLIIAGSKPPAAITVLKDARIEIKGFVSEEELDRLYKSVKLVIVPLRYGAGVKGKVIEAMHKGLPIVSTTIGIEGMPGNYNNFLKCYDDSQSFASKVISLYNDEEELLLASRKGTEYINQYFTFDIAAKKMKKLLSLDYQEFPITDKEKNNVEYV